MTEPGIRTPRIILYDLETSHNIVATFQLRSDDYAIPHRNLLQERYIICAAWKELDEHRIHSVATTDDAARYAKNPHDDYHVINTLHDVMSAADVVVAHNGNKFDNKFLNGRIVKHGLPPLPPFLKIDTCLEARKHFLFNSNRLDYLGEFLGFGRKADTEPGLWLKVLAGDPKAVKAMVRYNKRDIELLEHVFRKIAPYVQTYMNRQLMGDIGCPRCGSMKIQSRGIHKAISRTYQRYCCTTCGGWFRDAKTNSTGTKDRVL